MNVVIVESPAKAKTINDYLGKDYEVLASFGHVRDLPAKDGSVDPGQGLRHALGGRGPRRQARSPTSPARSRAPTSSSWRPTRTARARRSPGTCWRCCGTRSCIKDKPVERVVFNAITKCGDPRGDERIRARSTRRWSTPIWRAARSIIWSASTSRPCCGASCRARARRAACSRSRCASSATASARSRRFRPREYWSIVAHLEDRRPARRSRRGSSVPTAGRSRGSMSAPAPRRKDFRAALEAAPLRVASVEAKPAKRHPFPPFRTSTLQQDASRKLGLSPARTMQIAQRLYEGVQIGGETPGPHHLYADRRHRHGAGGHRGRPQHDRDAAWRPLRAAGAAQIHGQGQERAGSARGDPPDRFRAACPATWPATSNPSRPSSTS